MTAYATTTDFANLGLPASATGGMSADAITAALAAASRKVDGYLSDAFTLPLVTWSDDITEATCALAAWTLLSVRGFNPDRGADVAVRQRYEDAVRFLERVADGKITPVVTDSSPAAQPAAAPIVASDDQRGW